MTTELPPPLARYFAAKNRRDVDAALAPFSETASVRDEGHSYAGRAAIRAWMEETTRKYRVTAEVSEVTTDGDKTRVAAIVSGSFPGSPATLHFTFTTDKGRIEHLDIGA